MADELRAAAERLRRVTAGEPARLVYPHSEHYSPVGPMAHDRQIVADAYLAQHADDGEAVDEAWLRAVGLTDQWYDNTWGSGLHSERGGIAVQLDGRVMVQVGGTVGYLDGASAKTRGAVRRLAAALGVTLVEQP